MTPHELSRQEEHLFAVLSGGRFLKMEGLSNEVPFFIYPYEPEHALDVAKAKKRVKNRLASKGIEVREINLYDLSADVLKEPVVVCRASGTCVVKKEDQRIPESR